MNSNIIAGIIILLLVACCGGIIFLVKRSENKKFKELADKIATATPEILDIIDKLLANVDSVVEYDTVQDFSIAFLDKAVDKSLEYIKENAAKYEIPQNIVDLLTSDRMRSIIAKIIDEYKYESNINLVYDRILSLQLFDSDDEKSNVDNPEKVEQTNISEDVEHYYDDNGTDV